MELKKYIVTHEHEGWKFTNAVIVADTYSRTFGNYKMLIEEAIKDFCWLGSTDNVECLIANKNNIANAGYIAIIFPVVHGLTTKGYENTTKSPIY